MMLYSYSHMELHDSITEVGFSLLSIQRSYSPKGGRASTIYESMSEEKMLVELARLGRR